ncbi:L-aspartate oxidase [Paracoccus sp. M683]|uniref:L-aspartate oxidase n=1 Tax=Paracoccus sp. M683 TaxID=2594268 RepID=UPI00117E2F88|nr:L-aspartate oxidase [Paracoccus sp. M683]TRW99521.1 L-aspartate oxidase [Paracoccus sp. M683]
MNGPGAGPDDPVIVIGSGIAGLTTALALAPLPVLLLTRDCLGEGSSTALAQGGIAASVGADDDAGLHLADTLDAGDGLCDADIAATILDHAVQAIAMLARNGMIFDRDADGTIALGLEAAHSRRRILHAGGDGTGAAITEALARAVRACPSVTVIAGADARRLTMANGRVTGIMVHQAGGMRHIPAWRVVLATGGIGGLFDATTNPVGNYGAGVAMAARAGAVLTDMEFVQFHPTALASNSHPLALISEAVRGEGAILLNDLGQRFMDGTPGKELAPRDVTARAIHAQIKAGRRVFLDARAAIGDRFGSRFPGIARLCAANGIDPARDLIPVQPAAHYHMGGILTDAQGRSSLPGLWAVGECASTGLHGANRLASNSLLEAAVMGMAVARDIRDHRFPRRQPQPRPQLAPTTIAPADPAPVRAVVSRHLGVLRDAEGLDMAIAELLPLALSDRPGADPALVALSVAVFARLRQESRGAHSRTDFPASQPIGTRHSMTLSQIIAAAQGITAPDLVPARSA